MSRSFRPHSKSLHPVAAYELLFELGRGGMGSATLARAAGAGGFERLVVVKRMHRHLLEHPSAVQRFLDEARQAALVHHANVVGIHQVGSDAEGYFMVFDYVEGAGLDELVDRAGLRGAPVPPPIVLRIALDALSGLHAVHTARDVSGRDLSMLHRDVSPQNVIVGRDGVARLTDFGIAKSTLASVATDQKYLVGKLLYLPPEYLRHQPVGPSLDVYALGVSLWMALAGREPWPDADEHQLLTHVLEQGIPRLSDSGVRIAPMVEDIVASACDPEPSLRPRSARIMAESIEALGRETGWIASHGEVAAFVESLMGPDLELRRERTAAQVAGEGERATLVPEADEESPASGSPSGFPAPAPAGARRRVPGVVVAGSIAVLAIGIAAALLLRGAATASSGSTDASATPSAAPLAASPAAPSAAIMTEAPTAAPAGALPPAAKPTRPTVAGNRTPQPSTPDRIETPAAAAAEPPATTPPQATAPPLTPSLFDTPPPAATKSPTAPDSISKKNPYR